MIHQALEFYFLETQKPPKQTHVITGIPRKTLQQKKTESADWYFSSLVAYCLLFKFLEDLELNSSSILQ